MPKAQTTSSAKRSRARRQHPGEILERRFMRRYKLNPNAVARACCVAAPRLYAICQQRHGISPELAVRLGRLFDVDPRWFLERQAEYDLHQIEQRQGSRIRREVKPIRSGETGECERG